ncbi:snRNA-activating protein complex subunit 3 [Microtus ochrogaster]|uniref:snRNA-activating protein complex subunit 3 n=1 Tax=Microtus ochrogaster TaxID=79684 RepID=A0A8J6H1P7_MICOH|nr:snRNA-activating protein complex subunit 3 [Microtus ochrogaster]
MAENPQGGGAACSQHPVPSASHGSFPEYELPELHTRAFHVGAFGELWRGRLGARDLSLSEPQAAGQPADRGASDNSLEDAAVARDLGCSLEAAAELRVVCGLDKLRCLEEDEDPEVIPENTDLVTLCVRKGLLDYREENITIDRACRQETFAYEMESHALGKKPKNPEDMIKEGELILSVNILYPVIFNKHKEHKPYQTVLVLGSQKLTELRDSICCVSDLQIGGEFSSTPDQAPEHISKVRTIIEWSESHDRGYGKFQTARMEDFTFNDLNIKLGFPYLYCHQGDCEHVVVITDIRWVTNNDTFAPEDPCFFCDVCFRMLHYDSEGNKLGEFLAYPYVDPGTFN